MNHGLKKTNSTRNSYLLISFNKSELLLFLFGKDLVDKTPDSFAFEKVLADINVMSANENVPENKRMSAW